ncbi:hypothetical protein GCM10011392_40350 [Wenxinia marina]|nr:hypothetical protein GCM10011392_40350 [Wenxinia marina]
MDLARIGRSDIKGNLLTFRRQKTRSLAEVPIRRELRAVIDRTPNILTASILNGRGRPYSPESLGNMFRDAATAAGMTARLHGLRKAFCCYWAEQPGVTPHQIAAMAGHIRWARWSVTPAPPTERAWSNCWWGLHYTGHAHPRTGHAAARPSNATGNVVSDSRKACAKPIEG